MGAPLQSGNNPQLRLPKPPDALAPWREWCVSALMRLAAKQGIKVNIDGAQRSASSNDTLSFKLPDVPAASTADTHNWQPTFVDATHLTIGSGSVSGHVARIAATPLTDVPAPQLEVDDTDLNYVFAQINHTLNDTDGYITSMTIGNIDIGTNTTGLPSDTSTEKYILLFTWQAGALVMQSVFWNFHIIARDDGSVTSTPEYLTWVSA